jgi:hypothetical protein
LRVHKNSKGEYIQPSEIKAVNFENIIRKRTGDAIRTTYGEVKLKGSMLPERPGLHVFW